MSAVAGWRTKTIRIFDENYLSVVWLRVEVLYLWKVYFVCRKGSYSMPMKCRQLMRFLYGIVERQEG